MEESRVKCTRYTEEQFMGGTLEILFGRRLACDVFIVIENGEVGIRMFFDKCHVVL